jgi:single-strand DNA-binding protein
MESLTIIGNIGQDAKIQETNGNKFVSFSVACSKRYKKSDGSTVESTTWYSIICSNEKLVPYLKKGTKVCVIGEPKYSIYKKQTGGDWQVNVNLNVSKIELLSSSQNQNQSQETKETSTTQNTTDESFYVPPVIESSSSSSDPLPF